MAYLHEKKQGSPTLSHLMPISRLPLDHYLLSQVANPQPQISKNANEKRVARTVACHSSGMHGYALCDHSHRYAANETYRLALIFFGAATGVSAQRRVSVNYEAIRLWYKKFGLREEPSVFSAECLCDLGECSCHTDAV